MPYASTRIINSKKRLQLLNQGTIPGEGLMAVTDVRKFKVENFKNTGIKVK
jgi:hypothetical protein